MPFVKKMFLANTIDYYLKLVLFFSIFQTVMTILKNKVMRFFFKESLL